jgi:hypothetical protein
VKKTGGNVTKNHRVIGCGDGKRSNWFRIVPTRSVSDSGAQPLSFAIRKLVLCVNLNFQSD